MRSKKTFSCRAIVLNREYFGEADAYIELLTQPFGVVTALAKSARKSKRRYVGGLDVFCHDEVLLRGAPHERPYLVELTVHNAFIGLRDKLDRVLVAGKLVQWVRRLSPTSTPVPLIYSLLGQCLALLEREESPERMELLALVFKLRLLEQLGLKPHTTTCSRCAGPLTEPFSFDLESGGTICPGCYGAVSGSTRVLLSSRQIQSLQLAERVKLTQLTHAHCPSDEVESLSRLITRFAGYHTQVFLPT